MSRYAQRTHRSGRPVPPDVSLVRVGHHGDQPALGALPRGDLPDAGIGRGDVGLDVIQPEGRLVPDRVVVHAVLAPAHLQKAGGEVGDKIMLQRACPPRVTLIQILLEAGVVDRRGAVYHGVVVVKNQAFIFHAFLSLYRY